ncbi:mRNA cap guanine-N7 methyltransferase [Brachionus plicatilis]|uniref:mRNA cap guanine-N(7) methyltransferase n=1 Tax=Brachionus plicatilis TaxID=10195 RepID=A0A3M7RA42_BRAPC|nr:mRNA cap guanine-N7 methyltransferase [Brachionus plicatilis]
MSESLSSTVVEHYNKKNPSDLAARSKSRIFYMRNFNNWIKSVLINENLKIIRNDNRELSVLDLGCGKGGDSLKWINGKVSKVTFADIAENSLEECKNRVSKVNFETNFVHIDATKELLKDKMENCQLHELVSSQFVIHYSFESFEQADTFLKNVSDSLNPGGYFIGTTTNAAELIKRLRQTESNSFGNEIYQIKFYQDNKDYFNLFGVKFHFKLEGVVECPEFLVNFEALVRIAQRHGLKLLFKKTFAEFFNEYCQRPEYLYLIKKMQALEPYYPQDLADDTSKRLPGDYEYIDQKLQDEQFKLDLKPEETYATLSKSEWEAITLYIAFGFVKETDLKKEEDLSRNSEIVFR